jgi:hypothetical protein
MKAFDNGKSDELYFVNSSANEVSTKPDP